MGCSVAIMQRGINNAVKLRNKIQGQKDFQGEKKRRPVADRRLSKQCQSFKGNGNLQQIQTNCFGNQQRDRQ
jgi:hypothetical protein